MWDRVVFFVVSWGRFGLVHHAVLYFLVLLVKWKPVMVSHSKAMNVLSTVEEARTYTKYHAEYSLHLLLLTWWPFFFLWKCWDDLKEKAAVSWKINHSCITSALDLLVFDPVSFVFFSMWMVGQGVPSLCPHVKARAARNNTLSSQLLNWFYTV